MAIKIGRIGIHHQHPEPVQHCRHQDDEPADQRVMHMGRGDQDKDRQAGLLAQHGMHFIPEHRLFLGILLPTGSRIGVNPGRQQGRIDDQGLSRDHTQADQLADQPQEEEEDTRSGERVGFNNLEGLFEFLKEKIGEERNQTASLK